MTRTLEEVRDAAAGLTADERAELAEFLLATLDETELPASPLGTPVRSPTNAELLALAKKHAPADGWCEGDVEKPF